MTREQFAELIQWNKIIWFFGIFVNPLMIMPQLWEIVSTGRTEGVSLAFLGILMIVQWVFSAQGFFIRDKPIFVSNGLAGLATLLTALATIYFRA